MVKPTQNTKKIKVRKLKKEASTSKEVERGRVTFRD